MLKWTILMLVSRFCKFIFSMQVYKSRLSIFYRKFDQRKKPHGWNVDWLNCLLFDVRCPCFRFFRPVDAINDHNFNFYLEKLEKIWIGIERRRKKQQQQRGGDFVYMCQSILCWKIGFWKYSYKQLKFISFIFL